MKRSIALAAALVALVPAGIYWTNRHPAASTEGGPSTAAFPADVRAFIDQRDLCMHFSGEEPYDAARRAEIAAAVKRYCTGTDAALADLRQRYRDDKAVIAALSLYESDVE